MYLLLRHVCVSWDQFVLWLFAGDDHSTGCMIEVVRATSTAAAGHDGNDDGEEDNCADGACNSSSAPTTVWGTNSPTTILSNVTLVVIRAGTRNRTTDAFAITALLASVALKVVGTGANWETTDAFVITALLFRPTLVVVRTIVTSLSTEMSTDNRTHWGNNHYSR